MLGELKNNIGDRAKVNTWLDFINEKCPVIRAEVIKQCSEDTEARKYFIKRYNEDCKQ